MVIMRLNRENKIQLIMGCKSVTEPLEEITKSKLVNNIIESMCLIGGIV